MADNSKINVDLTVKAEAKMELSPTKEGANQFFSSISKAAIILSVGAACAWVITAIAPNGFL